MAGDWIKMRTSLPRDPRVVRMASALKADRLRTVGGLLSAWCLADELTEDGKLDAYTGDLLDDLVGLPGLAAAMESVGWLVIGDGFLEFPRFEEHNGRSAKRRAQDSVRKMSARKADNCPQGKPTNCGPEKRREEKSINGEREHRTPTLAQCLSAAPICGMTQAEANYYWDTRESTGWVKSTASGGTTPVVSFQSDMKTSVGWVREQMSKATKPAKRQPLETITFDD